MGLLARREHSRAELRQKLTGRGYEAAVVDTVLERLQAQHLQSDQRYVESYVTARSGRGYGPQRIRAELRERGIDAEQAERALAGLSEQRAVLIRDVWYKKFRGRMPADYRERARQMRFLQQRGFSSEDIHGLFAEMGDPA